ncbi:hypothetical protein H4R34_000210 [Dimargaris verticillata]|uniref:Uncharacterized protein n=1 Tax=Dimargaris verticillata TaxID=2761393 RepID=A0A9W8EEX1_9FUNG|nr:hypothetical protein H4R34_000210 [Dimargaris verticillata]
MPKDYVCVFCASSPGVNPEYAQKATGLMGQVASAVEQNHGDVLGVMVNSLSKLENRGDQIGQVILVPDMHTRKKTMNAKESGYGTMEELLEMTTWSQINIHAKPIILLNVCGFFDPLIRWINHASQEGFIAPGNTKIMVTCNSVDEALAALQTYSPPSSRYTHLEWTTEAANSVV